MEEGRKKRQVNLHGRRVETAEKQTNNFILSTPLGVEHLAVVNMTYWPASHVFLHSCAVQREDLEEPASKEGLLNDGYNTF